MAKEIKMKMQKNKVKIEPNTSKIEDLDMLQINDNSVINQLNVETPSKTVRIELSGKTLVLLLLVLALIFFGKDILSVLVLVFISLIISSATLPIIRWLVKKRLPKWLAMLIVYLSLVIVLIGTIAIVVVPFIQELINFVNNFPAISQKIIDGINSIQIPFLNIDKDSIKTSISGLLNNFTTDMLPIIVQGLGGAMATLSSLAGVLGGLFSLLTSIILSVYIVADHDEILDRGLIRFFDDRKRDLIRNLVIKLEQKLGSWLIGEATLCFIIGLMSWILLSVLNVPLAVPLAVMAGALESVPNLGPIISAIPAMLMALIAGGPVLAIAVMIGYILIQQLENNLIVPKVLSNAIGVKPVFVLIGLMFGFALGGVIGALLSVPIIGLLQILFDFYFDLQKFKARGRL